MRVLHVINDLRVGGAERLLVDLLPRLRAVGIDAEAVALGGVSPSHLQDDLQATVPLHLPPPGLPLRSPRHIARLARLMRRADVVHVHLFPAQLWAALAAATLPPRVRPVLVTTEHNTTNRRRGSRALHALDRWMYGRYDRIAAISEAAGASLAEWVPGTREKTCIIHSAVDVDRFAAAAPASRRDALGISEDTPVLVCVGRYEAQKDQATLIRALTHLPGWHAALVGDGELRPNLAAQAQATGVAERVHLLGRRADVPALVAMADVYAQPSLYEGWSVAVLEAMACGRAPVVASRAPGLADAVAGRGLLFEPGDADALAACVRRLRENPTESAALVNNARAWVENFRIERYVEAHQALYQEVTAMKQRGR